MDAIEENSEARAPIFFLAPWLCCEKHSPVTLYPPWWDAFRTRGLEASGTLSHGMKPLEVGGKLNHFVN